jgi:FkbM family methyltransferase
LDGRPIEALARTRVTRRALKLWLALWSRAAPRFKAPLARLVIRSSASSAPLRALMDWRPDWKTHAIGKILRSRKGVMIDVGANVGQTLLDFLAAPVRSTYLGFEPNVICYQHLAKLVFDNGLDECHVVPAALGNRHGITTLYRYGGDVDAGATTLRDLRPRLNAQGTNVCVFRLDELPEILPEPQIALIKIDTEGGELDALRGMEQTIARTQPWIMCEVLHRDVSAEAEPFSRRSDELMQFLSGIGYEVLHIVQGQAAGTIVSADEVSAFPDVVWDDESSPCNCDYLFVPKGQAEAARQVLGS